MTKVRNQRLTDARLALPPGANTQQAVADAVAALVATATGRRPPLDAGYISKLECGEITWPSADYRTAFRRHFGAHSDADLGFYSRRTQPRPALVEGHGRRPFTTQVEPGHDEHQTDETSVAGPDRYEEDTTHRRDALQVALLTGAGSLLPPSLPALAYAADNLSGQIPRAVVPAVADIVSRAQRMDDQHGSAARGYVADQHDALDRMLRRDSYSATTGRQLCSYLAQLAQTAAFMHYDAGLDQPAHHWYLQGINAARAAEDPALEASILSLMSNQAATCGKTSHALALADAACRAAAAAPAAVKALAAARSTLAHASAGDLSNLQRAHACALDALMRAKSQDPAPEWAYYLNVQEVDALAGRSMVLLARRLPQPPRSLLEDAKTLLTGRAYADDPSYARSGLRHTAWLALAHAKAQEIERAVVAGQRALELISEVSSARSLALLMALRADLAAHHDVPGVSPLMGDLQALQDRMTVAASPA